MPKLIVVTRAGEESVVEATIGQTILEAVNNSGAGELLALCGGCAACATCHVYIDRDFSDLLPEMTGEEHDLLDSSDHREDRSRLSCQISMKMELDGMKVILAPED